MNIKSILFLLTFVFLSSVSAKGLDQFSKLPGSRNQLKTDIGNNGKPEWQEMHRHVACKAKKQLNIHCRYYLDDNPLIAVVRLCDSLKK